ncbi:MAG: NAD-dependent epimerase/dehydratase family protein [Dehalococcoidia bacterium]|nr:NAD-dependent epimerase/dehydratase family protein [Dehalococcoidia bacterium]
MKTLVTGSTGLVGSALVESLIAKGYEVRALARKTSNLSHLRTTGAEIVFGDITEFDTLPPAVKGIDIVFHCAAKVTPGWGAWEDYERTTVQGTRNMLRASAEAGVKRFLQVSSYTVYGEACQKGDTPADETTPCEARKTPPTYYDYSKLLAEQACWEYHRQGKINVSMIRIGSAYGPRDRLLADRMYKQTSFPILMWPGKANPRYAIVYVSDIAELAILAATSDKAIGQVYNVAGPKPVRLKEFAEALIRARGVKRTWVTMPYAVAWVWCYLMETVGKLRRAKEMPYLTLASLRSINMEGYLDGSKARNELGWEPKVSLEEGTRLYVEWLRQQSKK